MEISLISAAGEANGQILKKKKKQLFYSLELLMPKAITGVLIVRSQNPK